MYRIFTFIVAALMLSPVVSYADAPAETVTIVADKWCPYNCDPGTEHPGLMIEIAQKAFAKHNIKVEYSIVPWTRAIEETRQNQHTAIVGAAHKDAPDFVFPELSQGMMHNSFYVKKGNPWTFTDISSLAQISLGSIADYSYNEALNEYIETHKKEPKLSQVVSGDNALENNFKKLLAGRIGALVEGEYVANYYMGQHGLTDKVEKAGSLPVSEDDEIFVAFSPKDPKAKHYADILTKETKAMRESGELEKILAAYNVADWLKK